MINDKCFSSDLFKPHGSIGKSAQYLFAGCAFLLLSACGTGTDSGSVNPQGESAAEVSTDVLQRNAADNAGKAISTNVNTMLQSLVGSSAINTALTSPGISQLFSTGATNLSDGSNANRILDDDLGQGLDSNIGTLMGATLGLEGNTQQVRVGNRITIDPDEQRICQEELLGMNTSAEELSQCSELFKELSVQIDAITDTSGLITYLFHEQPVLLVDYSPTNGSYELRLTGLKTVLQRVAELDSTADPVPEILEGAIKVSASVIDSTPDAESVNFSVEITQTLNIVDSADGTDILLSPSTLFSVTANEALGTASLEVALGALQLSSNDIDAAGGSVVSTFAMSGLTLRADLLGNGRTLNVSNFGIGKGPLTVSVNSTEAIRMSMETFGFSVNEDSGQIVLNDALGLSIDLNNTMQFLNETDSADTRASYTASAPSGTVMVEQADESLQVLSGGPFAFTYDYFDGANSASGTVTVSAGDCFSSENGAGSDALLKSAVCTP